MKRSYLKTVDNWGDKGMDRQQQKMAMEKQLKMHTTELTEFKSGNNIHQVS